MKSDAVFVLEQASWPALLVDSNQGVRHANPAAHSQFGPLLEKPDPRFSDLWARENSQGPAEFLSSVGCSPGRFRGAHGLVTSFQSAVTCVADNNEKLFLVQLFPEEIAGRSAPPQQPGETTFVQKQKLDCALQLARTVSLDFNNALTSILGHTSLLLARAHPEAARRNSLLEIEKSAARAAEIARDLGTFSRQEKETRIENDGNLNLLVQRSVEDCQQSLGAETVTWILQLERKPFAARFDETKMHQALNKILENAAQALNGNGRISVQTRNVNLEEPTRDRNAQLAPGYYVCVEVSDSGCGIEPDILPRIFEPFFTTKRGPVHRGLGLAWVYGIVTNHGGAVAVSSQPGAGTSVRVYLPAQKRIIQDTAIDDEDLNGSQTVLIVDDEDLMLTLGETVLTSFGYQVRTANNGQKALEILAESDHPVDLVVTDMVMPLMSGRELVDHISRVSPHTRVLCTSGCIRSSPQPAGAHYLQKPFTSQEFLRKVKQLLCAETDVDG